MPEGNALQGPKGTARLPGGRTPVKLPMAPFHQTHHAVSTEVVLHISSFATYCRNFTLSLFQTPGCYPGCCIPIYLTFPRSF